MSQFLSSMKEKVKLDLERMRQRAEGQFLPLKRSASMEAEAAEGKKIKSEPLPLQAPDAMEPQAVEGKKIKLEPKEEIQECKTTDNGHIAEEELNKAQLVELHCLVLLPKGDNGKKNPVHCPACSKVFEGRNRARIWQHVRCPEHRRKLEAKMQSFGGHKEHAGDQNPDVKGKMPRMKCGGLLLSSEHGQTTRIGSDLKPVFEDFVTVGNLASKCGPQGENVHSFTHLVTSNDWLIRHKDCLPDVETDVALDSAGGNPVCNLCLGVGDSKAFIGRICMQMVDMDLAKLLHARMYAEEKVEKILNEVRSGACYQRRCRSLYEKWLDAPLHDLHKHVACTWRGKMAHSMSVAAQYFCMHVVKVCIDVQPWHGCKEATMERMLQYMASDPNVPRLDLALVRNVVTGDISRHPAIHGMLSALALKIQMLEEDKSTMRNRFRTSLDYLWFWGIRRYGKR